MQKFTTSFGGANELTAMAAKTRRRDDRSAHQLAARPMECDGGEDFVAVALEERFHFGGFDLAVGAVAQEAMQRSALGGDGQHAIVDLFLVDAVGNALAFLGI